MFCCLFFLNALLDFACRTNGPLTGLGFTVRHREHGLVLDLGDA